jgi:hypothetical protein
MIALTIDGWWSPWVVVMVGEWGESRSARGRGRDLGLGFCCRECCGDAQVAAARYQYHDMRPLEYHLGHCSVHCGSDMFLTVPGPAGRPADVVVSCADDIGIAGRVGCVS